MSFLIQAHEHEEPEVKANVPMVWVRERARYDSDFGKALPDCNVAQV